MTTLRQTQPHFVRCIIPNETKSPGILIFKLFFLKFRFCIWIFFVFVLLSASNHILVLHCLLIQSPVCNFNFPFSGICLLSVCSFFFYYLLPKKCLSWFIFKKTFLHTHYTFIIWLNWSILFIHTNHIDNTSLPTSAKTKHSNQISYRNNWTNWWQHWNPLILTLSVVSFRTRPNRQVNPKKTFIFETEYSPGETVLLKLDSNAINDVIRFWSSFFAFHFWFKIFLVLSHWILLFIF